MKMDARWDPVAAYRRAHPLGRVTEKLKDVFCTCGYEDKAWVPVEPWAPGWIYAWKCPVCHNGIMLETARADGCPDEAPDRLPWCRGDWDERVIENLGHDPVVIRSRQHYKDELKRRGLTNAWGEGAHTRQGQDLWGNGGE